MLTPRAPVTRDAAAPAPGTRLGCGPTVGIAGLTLGGGLGILGRKHGLTCDHLLAVRVVLADGRIVDCDQRHHGELFWALRGAGGGHFGVVTSLVFSTLRAPAATRFHLTWPHTHAAAVIAAWQTWAPAAPDELWVTRSRACVHPWGSGRVYPNFPDPDLADWASACYGTNYERLVRVKRTYDPYSLFRFEQSL